MSATILAILNRTNTPMLTQNLGGIRESKLLKPLAKREVLQRGALRERHPHRGAQRIGRGCCLGNALFRGHFLTADWRLVIRSFLFLQPENWAASVREASFKVVPSDQVLLAVSAKRDPLLAVFQNPVSVLTGSMRRL